VTDSTQFSGGKIILRACSCAAQDTISALQNEFVEVVPADHAPQPVPELRTNSDLIPPHLNLTIG
jgi:hypothetical protein